MRKLKQKGIKIIAHHLRAGSIPANGHGMESAQLQRLRQNGNMYI